jgi:hypothetical protein
MRLLHISDWHLGRSFHGASMLDGQAGALDRIVELAREAAVDLVVIASDLYDRAIPPAEAVSLFTDTLARLRSAPQTSGTEGCSAAAPTTAVRNGCRRAPAATRPAAATPMHRWPTFCGVQLTEAGIEPIEGLIRQFPEPPQWMAGRDPLLLRHVGEQGAAALPVTSHLGWAVGPFSRVIDFSANS